MKIFLILQEVFISGYEKIGNANGLTKYRNVCVCGGGGGGGGLKGGEIYAKNTILCIIRTDLNKIHKIQESEFETFRFK